MLREVLKSIADGNSTISEISKSTGMEESTVVHAVSELKIMSYLESSICSMNKPMCKNCPMSSVSHERVFHITEKGMEYLKKS
jgi:hypothetical protein